MSVEYLCDKSVLGHLHRDHVLDAFLPMLERGAVAICTPTLLEQQHSARDLDDLDRTRDVLIGRMERVPMPDAAGARAEAVQRQLVAASQHRAVSVADLLVAATAEHHGLTVLHIDRDFDAIAALTGQPSRWLVDGGDLAGDAPIGRRPRDTGLQIWSERRPQGEPDLHVVGLVCATCRSAIGDHRDGTMSYAVDDEGEVVVDRWVVTHERCTRAWEQRHDRYRYSWELSWLVVHLLRSLAVDEPEPGRFDLADRIPDPAG